MWAAAAVLPDLLLMSVVAAAAASPAFVIVPVYFAVEHVHGSTAERVHVAV